MTKTSPGVQTKRLPLERLTVNLIPRASAALALAVQITGDNRTDTVNRALQFYAFAEEVMKRGGEILVRDPSSGEMSVVKFM